jgi:uncharacterized membrane protein
MTRTTQGSANPALTILANPSSWSGRVPVAILALLGCALATYLTLYQWHITATVWDPLFSAHSSEAVLTSSIDRLLPLPDATLGAMAYLVEAVVTLLGGAWRWRTAPWLVIVYGLVLAGLALTSLGLVLTQIFLVHALCTLCLCSAAISFLNAWLGHDEVFGAIQMLKHGARPERATYGRTA